jgi:hypothetical protein
MSNSKISREKLLTLQFCSDHNRQAKLEHFDRLPTVLQVGTQNDNMVQQDKNIQIKQLDWMIELPKHSKNLIKKKSPVFQKLKLCTNLSGNHCWS